MNDSSFLGLGLAILAVVVLVALGIGLFIIYLVYNAMKGIPEKHRPMDPGLVWLLLIPLFNLFWNFKVFPPMLQGYKAALQEKGVPVESDGHSIALTYCICSCLCVIPFVNILAGLACLVTFIITLVKAYDFKGLAA